MTIELGPGIEEPFETGAKFFTALAFPAVTEAAARRRAMEAMCARVLRMTNIAERCELPFLDARINAYTSVDPNQAAAALRTLKRRISDRFHAARAARPILHAMIAGGPHRPVEGIKRFTSRQIAGWIHHQRGPDPHNFLKRIWRPSKPVLHLAVAVDTAFLGSGIAAGEVAVETQELELIGLLVLRAAALQELIAADPKLHVNRSTQLTLRWIE